MSAWLALLRPWRIYLVLALIAAVAGVYIYRGQMLVIARAELATTQSQLDEAQRQIAQQNAEIQRWKQESSRQGRQITSTQTAAARIAVTTETTARTILTAAVPQQCDAAVQWGAQQAAALAADWR